MSAPRTRLEDAETLRIEPSRATPATAPRLLVVGTTSARAEGASKVPAGQSFALPAAGAVVVGRGDDAHVRIEDASVSRRHASLHAGERVEVEDLGSASGTRVHDRALGPGERAALCAGDLVEFGAVLCMLQGSALERAAQPAELPGGVVVASPAMQQLHALVGRVARSNVAVLVLGETGVGKEVVAERLHASSPRAAGPYVKVHCGNLTESLVEGELFGYEQGALTGANASRAGLIEAAEGGTLFLDEVGELPPATQTRLMRVLEDREVRRVGAPRGRAVDVRFVAATSRDPEAEVAAGRFRADLFYRLNGFVLAVPPLRERVEEVAPLALRFARAARAQLGAAGEPALDDAARAALEGHAWPGNVRELRNVMQRAVLLADDGPIRAEHLPPWPGSRASASDAPPGDLGERERIVDALAQCVGNQTRAAKMLGFSRRTLVTKMERHNLPRPRKGTDDA